MNRTKPTRRVTFAPPVAASTPVLPTTPSQRPRESDAPMRFDADVEAFARSLRVSNAPPPVSLTERAAQIQFENARPLPFVYKEPEDKGYLNSRDYSLSSSTVTERALSRLEELEHRSHTKGQSNSQLRAYGDQFQPADFSKREARVNDDVLRRHLLYAESCMDWALNMTPQQLRDVTEVVKTGKSWTEVSIANMMRVVNESMSVGTESDASETSAIQPTQGDESVVQDTFVTELAVPDASSMSTPAKRTSYRSPFLSYSWKDDSTHDEESMAQDSAAAEADVELGEDQSESDDRSSRGDQSPVPAPRSPSPPSVESEREWPQVETEENSGQYASAADEVPLASSLVKGVVSASGQGCARAVVRTATSVVRGHRDNSKAPAWSTPITSPSATSNCVLLLRGRQAGGRGFVAAKADDEVCVVWILRASRESSPLTVELATSKKFNFVSSKPLGTFHLVDAPINVIRFPASELLFYVRLSFTGGLGKAHAFVEIGLGCG